MYCEISPAAFPSRRPLIQNVVLTNCDGGASTISAALIEDVVLDGLKTAGNALWLNGCAYKHVIVRGEIDTIMMCEGVPPDPDGKISERYRRHNAALYNSIDWALDISGAHTKGLAIQGVPANRIRRDPETQAVIRLDKAMAGGWRELELGFVAQMRLNELVRSQAADTVLIAPKRSRRFFRECLADIELLRRAGVAEPD